MKICIARSFQRDLEYYPGTLLRIWYLTLIVTATIVLYCDGSVTSTVLPLVLHAFHLSLAGYLGSLPVSRPCCMLSRPRWYAISRRALDELLLWVSGWLALLEVLFWQPVQAAC